MHIVIPGCVTLLCSLCFLSLAWHPQGKISLYPEIILQNMSPSKLYCHIHYGFLCGMSSLARGAVSQVRLHTINLEETLAKLFISLQHSLQKSWRMLTHADRSKWGINYCNLYYCPSSCHIWMALEKNLIDPNVLCLCVGKTYAKWIYLTVLSWKFLKKAQNETDCVIFGDLFGILKSLKFKNLTCWPDKVVFLCVFWENVYPRQTSATYSNAFQGITQNCLLNLRSFWVALNFTGA